MLVCTEGLQGISAFGTHAAPAAGFLRGALQRNRQTDQPCPARYRLPEPPGRRLLSPPSNTVRGDKAVLIMIRPIQLVAPEASAREESG